MTKISPSSSSSRFIDLIQRPTDDQKHALFGNPGILGFEGTIGEMFDVLFGQEINLEQHKKIQKTVSCLLETLSDDGRYEFKKMIVDLIKSNLSYVDELKRAVRKTDDGLERNVLLGKIKMIEEDIDELEIPTEETKKMKLTKNVPAILLDRSVIFRPSKNEVITFVRKVILRKDYGRISENLQWCREDSN